MGITTDPNDKTLYLEWAGDFFVAPNGGILLATGWDQVRQRIIRRLLTNPQFQLADGTQVPAGYIFNTDYGEGFRRLIGEPSSQTLENRIKARVNAAVLIDQSVDATKPPLISFFNTPRGELYVSILVSLKTQQQGTIVLSVTE